MQCNEGGQYYKMTELSEEKLEELKNVVFKC